VRETISRAAAEIGETIGLGVLEGRNVLVVEKGMPPRPFTWYLPVGSTMPAHATAAGKVLLSGLHDAEVKARVGSEEPLPSLGPNTITSLAELVDQLAFVRRRGYALDDEEFEEGLRCVAVPVRAADGMKVSHSLGITAPVSRVTHQQLRELAGFLAELADEVGRYLALERAVAAL
jgi:IclR family KDG regulon transcriptional repressor